MHTLNQDTGKIGNKELLKDTEYLALAKIHAESLRNKHQLTSYLNLTFRSFVKQAL